jgi:hypothetical protein
LTNRITPFWSIPTRASGTASSRCSNLVVLEGTRFPQISSTLSQNLAEAEDFDKGITRPDSAQWW